MHSLQSSRKKFFPFSAGKKLSFFTNITLIILTIPYNCNKFIHCIAKVFNRILTGKICMLASCPIQWSSRVVIFNLVHFVLALFLLSAYSNKLSKLMVIYQFVFTKVTTKANFMHSPIHKFNHYFATFYCSFVTYMRTFILFYYALRCLGFGCNECWALYYILV